MSAGQRQNEVGRTLLRADRIIDGRSAATLAGRVVAIEGGRIAGVGVLDDFGVLDADVRLYDFPGCTLLPGLVDTHVHLTFSASPYPFRDLQAESDVELVLRASRNARSALQAGVTTVRDLGCRNRTALDVRDAIARGLIPGPRVLAAGRPVTVEGGHLHFFGGVASGEAGVRQLTRDLLEEGVDAIKVIATGGNMTVGSDPLTPAFTLAEARVIVETAHGANKRVAAHARSVPGIRQMVEAGADSIEHCRMEVALGQWGFDEQLACQMGAAGIVAAPTMAASYRAFQFRASGGDIGLQPIAIDIATRQQNAARLRECGVTVVVGTDAGAALATFDEAAHIELELLVEAGWHPLDALRAATLDAAQAIGLQPDVGSLEVGKVADVVVVLGDSSRTISDVRRVYAVFQAGRLSVFDGQLVEDARPSLGYRLSQPLASSPA
jgi:imidazolonepropionase-like amidohydrolase